MEKVEIITPTEEVPDEEGYLMLGITLERYKELEHKVYLYLEEQEDKVLIAEILVYISKICIHINELAYLIYRISMILNNHALYLVFNIRHKMIEHEKVSKMVQSQQKD